MDLSASWDYVEAVTKSRLANNKTSRHVADYGTYIETIGTAGELAVRRFLKMPETLHKHFDGGSDLLWNNRRVDVKATILTPRIRFRYLQWRVGKHVKADIIMLTAVNIERRQAILVGWATPDEILRAPVNDKRDYACHEIPTCSLHGAHELLQPRAESFEGIRQQDYAISA